MLKRSFKTVISLVLAVVLTFSTCIDALAASSTKTYIKDVVLSYGKTADEAKAWLTENGYEILDYDLNEDADDTFSTSRAVYLGYTTTDNAEEAITDMRLMNMKGGYSVQDYQMLLADQKANIKIFLDDFIVAIKEYRYNYNAGQARAEVAHEILNLLYDDDSEQYMGDALLNKIKEEYTDEEWSALSADEQAKTADMTTILMQANAHAILAIEQTIAMAADRSSKLWTERYESVGSYDDMLDELMEEKNLTVNEAEKELAAEYDEDAKAIASKFTDYQSFLGNYTGAGITLASSEEEIDAYRTAHEDFDYANWFAAGTQYELLDKLVNDDVSLLELVTGDDYDVLGADRYMLYPLVSCLSDGQRACLDFLTMYYIVSIGIGGDEAAEKAMKNAGFLDSLAKEKNSVYDGVDRTMFGGSVALTNDALRLQASSGKNAVSGAWNQISATSFVLYGVFTLSVVLTAASFVVSSRLSSLIPGLELEREGFLKAVGTAVEEGWNALDAEVIKDAENATELIRDRMADTCEKLGSVKTWSKVFQYAGIAMTCVSAALLVYSIWNTYTELKAYYNAEFTPIPMHMVDESTNDAGEKVYTYYTAVKCNRAEAGFVTDANKLLEDYGDINGDVGRQWVALYTTKDKAAGDPITTVPVVRYESSDIPKGSSNALSMFGENVAQNLTNKQLGYTYADGMGGIYMFYNVDESAFAGSVFSNSSHILISVAAAAVVGIAAFLAGVGVKKKKVQGEEA